MLFDGYFVIAMNKVANALLKLKNKLEMNLIPVKKLKSELKQINEISKIETSQHSVEVPLRWRLLLGSFSPLGSVVPE